MTTPSDIELAIKAMPRLHAAGIATDLSHCLCGTGEWLWRIRLPETVVCGEDSVVHEWATLSDAQAVTYLVGAMRMKFHEAAYGTGRTPIRDMLIDLEHNSLIAKEPA